MMTIVIISQADSGGEGRERHVGRAVGIVAAVVVGVAGAVLLGVRW